MQLCIVLHAKFLNDFTIEEQLIGKSHFVRFECKMSFGGYRIVQQSSGEIVGHLNVDCLFKILKF